MPATEPPKPSLTASEIFADAPEAVAFALAIKDSINALNATPGPHTGAQIAAAFGIPAGSTLGKGFALADKLIAQSKD